MNLNKNKHNERLRAQTHSGMSDRTKGFIQKICYKKTASVDMTKYGFINECKTRPVNLLLKPLRQQLEKICGKPSKVSTGRTESPSKRSEKRSPTRVRHKTLMKTNIKSKISRQTLIKSHPKKIANKKR